MGTFKENSLCPGIKIYFKEARVNTMREWRGKNQFELKFEMRENFAGRLRSAHGYGKKFSFAARGASVLRRA